MSFVYILYSEQFNRFYIGQTNNIENRVKRHNTGYEKSTKAFIPWTLLLRLEKSSRAEAMILERKLKNLNIADLQKFINKYS